MDKLRRAMRNYVSRETHAERDGSTVQYHNLL
jgi:hypothetical protein